jgi:GGDEF domain-containing protein
MPAMSASEMVSWCLLLGALQMLVLMCVTEFVRHRARWSIETGAYIATLAMLTLTMSGVAQLWLGKEHAAQIAVLMGVAPVASMVLGSLGMRNWLRTKGREQFADASLLIAFGACCGAMLWVLIFPPSVDATGNPLFAAKRDDPNDYTLMVSWAASWLGVFASTFASLRVALHGDKRSWLMFAVCLLNVPVPLILTLRVLLGFQTPMGILFPAMICQGLSAWLLVRNAWERHRIMFNANRILEDNRGIDPVTRLPHGGALVSQMEQAYSRSHKLLRHRPVVVVVQLFNSEEILKESGDNGWNQVVLATLARIRRIVSPADLVGRYYGGCFVIQINSRVTPQYLRGLGLRLASSTRRPVTPRTPPSGFESDEPIETDVGVGLFWCDDVGDLTMALHEAERAATVAQTLRSRAAVVLRPRADAVAVEKALGEAKYKGSLGDRVRARMRALASDRGARAPRGAAEGQAAPTQAVLRVVRRNTEPATDYTPTQAQSR